MILMPDKEKMVTVEITAREAHLIEILRHYNYGKIIVYKAEGQLLRVEPSESQVLHEEGGLEFASENKE